MRFASGFVSTFLLLSLLTAAGVASQFEGHITNVNGEHVKFTDRKFKKSYALTSDDDFTKKVVVRLKKNDFLSFEGGKNVTNKSLLRIDSINYVGLSDLMGVWTGDDKYCYKFTSYTEFIIYPNQGDCLKKPVDTPREFAYTVNAADEDWFMLLSDNGARYAADLKFNNCRSAEINLYDANTGNSLRLIKLTK